VGTINKLFQLASSHQEAAWIKLTYSFDSACRYE